MKFGGRAMANGIMFQSNKAIVKAVRKTNNEIEISFKELKEEKLKTKNKYENIIKKIPLIRGIYSFMFTNGTLFLRLLILLMIIQDILGFAKTNIQNLSIISNLYLFILLIISIISIIFYVYSFVYLKKFLQYHGAEHKTINAFENNIPLNIIEVKKCSRVNYRCGTIFAIFILLCILILSKFISFISLIFLIAVGIAEELYSNDTLYKYGFKYLYVLGGYIQKYLTTLEPNEKQLEVGIACMKKLIEIENKTV